MMKIKSIIKGWALAAFGLASAGVVTTTLMTVSMKKNDISIDVSQAQIPIDFHGIPAEDAMIGMYASYFSGIDENGNFRLDSRAPNTFGMNNALLENFTGLDSPWIMLDSLSDGRNGSAINDTIAGGHFITMYHRKTQQIMIAMPGMEYDYNPNNETISPDTWDDLGELINGNQHQTIALREYIEAITDRMLNGEFTDTDGTQLILQNDRPVIIGHSMASRSIHVMAIAGYDTIIVEPRPLTNNYLEDITALYTDTIGTRLVQREILAGIAEHNITLRAANANIWNSPLMPWTSVHYIGDYYIYGNGGTNFADRHVAGTHAAEVAVPSILRTFDGESAATEAPKGIFGMQVMRLDQ
jgi:hypothetical protein